MPEQADNIVVQFMVRAAREFLRGGWVFTGFHWPVLAGQVAHGIGGRPFVQAFEAGATVHGAGRLVPTSTTDYPAYENAIGYTGDTASMLLAMGRRYDLVVLDASNIDLLGQVNSSIIGPNEQPSVRLPGGGGAPDIAAQAKELVWLNGSADLGRFQRRVDHVTAAPNSGALVRMVTRWGVVRLGTQPRLMEVADLPGTESFLAHVQALGVETGRAERAVPAAADEITVARDVLAAAAGRGYQVAQKAFKLERRS